MLSPQKCKSAPAFNDNATPADGSTQHKRTEDNEQDCCMYCKCATLTLRGRLRLSNLVEYAIPASCADSNPRPSYQSFASHRAFGCAAQSAFCCLCFVEPAPCRAQNYAYLAVDPLESSCPISLYAMPSRCLVQAPAAPTALPGLGRGARLTSVATIPKPPVIFALSQRMTGTPSMDTATPRVDKSRRPPSSMTFGSPISTVLPFPQRFEKACLMHVSSP